MKYHETDMTACMVPLPEVNSLLTLGREYSQRRAWQGVVIKAPDFLSGNEKGESWGPGTCWAGWEEGGARVSDLIMLFMNNFILIFPGLNRKLFCEANIILIRKPDENTLQPPGAR